MAKREDYPSLSSLLDDLKRLDATGSLQSGAARVKGGGKLRFTRGLAIGRFTWPGVGDFWLNAEQQQVVAILLEAYFECDNPNVRDSTLLAAIGSSEPKLSRVFQGCDAWGKLVIAGSATGTSRLATPIGGDVVGDDEGAEGEPADEWIE